jgi:hypothetical protein
MTVAKIAPVTEVPCMTALSEPLSKPEQTCADGIMRLALATLCPSNRKGFASAGRSP